MILNVLLKALLLLPILGTSLGVAIVIGSWLQDNIGDADLSIHLSVPIIALLFSLVLFLIDDGTRFLTHLAMHRVPFLWSRHKLHHSATVLTPLTIYRVYPLESTIYFARGVLSAGLVIGVFVWLFGGMHETKNLCAHHSQTLTKTATTTCLLALSVTAYGCMKTRESLRPITSFNSGRRHSPVPFTKHNFVGQQRAILIAMGAQT